MEFYQRTTATSCLDANEGEVQQVDFLGNRCGIKSLSYNYCKLRSNNI